jgi:glycosyltransferase involved in cell wall biosynthesis
LATPFWVNVFRFSRRERADRSASRVEHLFTGAWFPSGETMTVGIVVPAFRPDVERLSAFVRSLHEEFDDPLVRVELDGARRETVDALATLPATVASAPERRGKGAAVTAGFEALVDEADVLAFADADGATPAASIGDVVAAVTGGRADLAAGSRRHPDSDVRSHQTYLRRWLGDGFAWLARRLLAVGIYDYQCGAKAISADAWRAVRAHLYEPRFAWDVELVAMAGALGFDVVEVPVTWEDQPNSTVSPVRTPVELFRAVVAARHRAKLVADHPLHSAIAARREAPTALVDRVAGDRHE